MTTTYRLNSGLIEVVTDGVPTGNFIEKTDLVDVPGSPVTFTQTYSTAATTVPAATAATPTVTTVTTAVTKTNTSPYGFSSGDADKVVTFCGAVKTDLDALSANDALINADILALKKVVNSIIDALQAANFAA